MFDRVRFHHEFAEDGGGGGGVAEAPAPPAESAPSWQPTQEWGNRIDQFIEQTGPVLGQLSELFQADEQQTEPMFDPYTGAPLEEQVDPRLQQMIASEAERIYNERIGPFQPLLGHIADREGEQVARSHLEGLANDPQVGGPFNQDNALLFAQTFANQGMGPEEALRAGAAHAANYERSIREVGVTEYNQGIAAAANAQGDLGQGPTSSIPGREIPTGRDRYEQVVARYTGGISEDSYY